MGCAPAGGGFALLVEGAGIAVEAALAGGADGLVGGVAMALLAAGAKRVACHRG